MQLGVCRGSMQAVVLTASCQTCFFFVRIPCLTVPPTQKSDSIGMGLYVRLCRILACTRLWEPLSLPPLRLAWCDLFRLRPITLAHQNNIVGSMHSQPLHSRLHHVQRSLR